MKSGGHALFIATQHGTHTHMHMQDGGRCSLPFPILESSPRDIQEQWAASDAAPGDQVQVLGPDLVRVRTDEHLLFHTSLMDNRGDQKKSIHARNEILIF